MFSTNFKYWSGASMILIPAAAWISLDAPFDHSLLHNTFPFNVIVSSAIPIKIDTSQSGGSSSAVPIDMPSLERFDVNPMLSKPLSLLMLTSNCFSTRISFLFSSCICTSPSKNKQFWCHLAGGIRLYPGTRIEKALKLTRFNYIIHICDFQPGFIPGISSICHKMSIDCLKKNAKTSKFFTLVTFISYFQVEIKSYFHYNTILLFKRRQRIYVTEEATGTFY